MNMVCLWYNRRIGISLGIGEGGGWGWGGGGVRGDTDDSWELAAY